MQVCGGQCASRPWSNSGSGFPGIMCPLPVAQGLPGLATLAWIWNPAATIVAATGMASEFNSNFSDRAWLSEVLAKPVQEVSFIVYVGEEGSRCSLRLFSKRCSSFVQSTDLDSYRKEDQKFRIIQRQF